MSIECGPIIVRKTTLHVWLLVILCVNLYNELLSLYSVQNSFTPLILGVPRGQGWP